VKSEGVEVLSKVERDVKVGVPKINLKGIST
jgi:hypothetical protein